MKRASLLLAFAVVLVVALGACGDNIHPPVDTDNSIETVAPQQVHAGDVITVTCILDEGGQTSDVQAQLDVVDDSSVSHVGDELIARKVGMITIACAMPAMNLVDPTPSVVEILPGAAADLVTQIAPNPATAGDTVTATCTVFDSSGNLLDGYSPTLTITPSDPGNTITDLTAVMTRAGHYDAECALPGATSNDAGFDVGPGLPASLVLGAAPSQPVYAVNDDITITSIVADQYGNPIPGAPVGYTSTPVTGAGPTTVVSPGVFSYGGDGTYLIDGTVTGPTQGDVPVTASIDVVVDSLGPAITCGSPGDGTMLNAAAGSMLTFQGASNAPNGTSSVTIDGAPATLNPDNSFSGTITTRFGINFVSVTATDAYDIPTTKICTFLAASQWANPTTTYAGVLGLSLGQGAIDDGNRSGAIGSLGDILYKVANSTGIVTELDSALQAANPLKPEGCDSQTCVFGECVCWYSSGIEYVAHTMGINGPNTDSLTLVTNGLATKAQINGAHMTLHVHGAVSGIGYDTTGTVSVSSIAVALTLVPGVSGGVPHITVQANSTSVSVGSISTSFSGVDGWIINNIVVPLAQGSLKNEVANVIQSYINNNFDAALDGIFSGLDISSLAASFNVPRLYGGGTVPLSFGIAFSSIDTNPTRLRFGIGTKLTSTIANTYSTLGVAVPAGTVLGDPNPSPADTAVTAHIALFNQALHALWRANYFTADVYATSIDANAPPDLQAVLSARLPPVADFLADGNVELSLGDIDIALTGSEVPPGLVITIGGRAHTSVTLTGNSLSFGPITLDDTEVSLDALGLSTSAQAQVQELITNALPQLVSGSLSNALPSLPIPSFPIPASLATYGITGSTLSVMSPALLIAPPEFVLRGTLGIQ